MDTNNAGTKQQIIENERVLLNAFQNCDLEVIARLLHTDAMFVYPNGLVLSTQVVLDNYRSGNSAFSSIVASDQEINLIGDNAIVSMALELSGKYKEQLISQKFRYIRVCKQCDDGWKVIAVSGTPL